MPISELVAIQARLDDRFGCPLAEAAANRWGCSQAVFIRSSASHVFVARRSVNGKRVVLRMRPETLPAAGEILRRSAWAAAALAAAGAPVARPLPSRRGEPVERVDGYLVTALEAVEGDARDGDDLDEESARTWGALLADLHAHGQLLARDQAAPLPETTEVLVDLPRTPEVYGLLHGDPEIDNLVWTGSRAVFVDFDDVHHGWYAADIAFALRAWAPPAAAPDLRLPVPSAFLDGYRRRRPFTAEEQSWLPVLARAGAAETLARLEPVLSEPADDDWPDWAHAILERVRTRAAQLRTALG